MGLIWELWQHNRIGTARDEAGAASSTANRTAMEFAHLERRVERLALACQAMWELLAERTGVTEQELMEHMEQIDLRDGAADGKMQAQTLTCPTCNRRVNTKRTICMYCTHPLPRPHAFE